MVVNSPRGRGRAIFRTNPDTSRVRSIVASLAGAAVITLGCGLLSPPAHAQGDFRGGGFHGGDFHGGGFHGDFHGRDFGRFGPDELRFWRGGLWRHEWHDGRLGWWWIVGDGWYFYPEPIYPYPTYVAPALVVQPAPPLPTGLPPAQFWYFCDSPRGYYPYVASCAVPWHEVPVNPAQPAPK
jgi:hypothetical protein